jgi:hypothetical protein
MKICNVCKQEKVIDDFPKAPCFRDGHGYTCNKCQAIRIKRWADNNKIRVSIKSRRWKEKNRDRWREQKRNYEAKKRNTVAGKLHNAMHNGIYGGQVCSSHGRGSLRDDI